METTEFNKWLFEVCRIASSRSTMEEKDEQYYFVRTNLTDAKLAFIDGETPEEYCNIYLTLSNKY